MKKFDFIIGYEHKNREIESVCLLKYELERRGYTVCIYNINDYRMKEHIKLYHAKVLLLPFAHEDKTIYLYVYRAIIFDKLINLQWEQAITRQQENDPNSHRNPSGICKHAVHLSWGKANLERLTKIAGIDSRNVKLVGNITMDFLKEPLSNYYLQKEEIFKKFGLPLDKKVCIFIASFKSAYLSSEELEKQCKIYGEWRKTQHVIALKTMKTILEWITRALDDDPNLYFIYRPHPGEWTGETMSLLTDIQKRYDRFIIIQDLSVKQWILVVDKIYTWMSTTIAEVYFAEKSCAILYPYELPAEMNAKLFDDMKPLIDYSTFYASLQSANLDFPIDINKLDDYYSVDSGMSYLKIANVCEEVLHDPFYTLDKKEIKKIYELYTKNQTLIKKICIYLWQLDWLYNLFWLITIRFSLKGKYFEKKRNDRVKIEKWNQEEGVSDADIANICHAIEQCIKGDDV